MYLKPAGLYTETTSKLPFRSATNPRWSTLPTEACWLEPRRLFTHGALTLKRPFPVETPGFDAEKYEFQLRLSLSAWDSSKFTTMDTWEEHRGTIFLYSRKSAENRLGNTKRVKHSVSSWNVPIWSYLMGFHVNFIALTIQLGHFQLYPNSAGAFWSICVLGQVWISSELHRIARSEHVWWWLSGYTWVVGSLKHLLCLIPTWSNCPQIN